MLVVWLVRRCVPPPGRCAWAGPDPALLPELSRRAGGDPGAERCWPQRAAVPPQQDAWGGNAEKGGSVSGWLVGCGSGSRPHGASLQRASRRPEIAHGQADATGACRARSKENSGAHAGWKASSGIFRHAPKRSRREGRNSCPKRGAERAVEFAPRNASVCPCRGLCPHEAGKAARRVTDYSAEAWPGDGAYGVHMHSVSQQPCSAERRAAQRLLSCQGVGPRLLPPPHCIP